MLGRCRYWLIVAAALVIFTAIAIPVIRYCLKDREDDRLIVYVVPGPEQYENSSFPGQHDYLPLSVDTVFPVYSTSHDLFSIPRQKNDGVSRFSSLRALHRATKKGPQVRLRSSAKISDNPSKTSPAVSQSGGALMIDRCLQAGGSPVHVQGKATNTLIAATINGAPPDQSEAMKKAFKALMEAYERHMEAEELQTTSEPKPRAEVKFANCISRRQPTPVRHGARQRMPQRTTPGPTVYRLRSSLQPKPTTKSEVFVTRPTLNPDRTWKTTGKMRNELQKDDHQKREHDTSTRLSGRDKWRTTSKETSERGMDFLKQVLGEDAPLQHLDTSSSVTRDDAEAKAHPTDYTTDNNHLGLHDLHPVVSVVEKPPFLDRKGPSPTFSKTRSRTMLTGEGMERSWQSRSELLLDGLKKRPELNEVNEDSWARKAAYALRTETLSPSRVPVSKAYV